MVQQPGEARTDDKERLLGWRDGAMRLPHGVQEDRRLDNGKLLQLMVRHSAAPAVASEADGVPLHSRGVLGAELLQSLPRPCYDVWQCRFLRRTRAHSRWLARVGSDPNETLLTPRSNVAEAAT